jgi:hypothetical protein
VDKVNIDGIYHPQLVHVKASYVGVSGPRRLTDLEHWALIYRDEQGALDEPTYKLLVRFHYGLEGKDAPYQFALYEMDSGNEVELVTDLEWADRVKAIADHEGMEEAERWLDKQDGDYPDTRMRKPHEGLIYAALKRRWLAVCELISPHVTM